MKELLFKGAATALVTPMNSDGSVNYQVLEDLIEEQIINNIQNADCPIDSIILDKLSEETKNKEYILDHKWSKYGTKSYPVEKYNKVQKTISELESVQGKSNLYYDFIAWRQ